MASLAAIAQSEASWSPDETTPTIEQSVRNVAWAKSRYGEQGFGRPMVLNYNAGQIRMRRTGHRAIARPPGADSVTERPGFPEARGASCLPTASWVR